MYKQHLFLISCLSLCSFLSAAPGDLLDSAAFADQDWSDIAWDPAGTIWALGRMDGMVYKITSDLQLSGEENSLAHPFGPAIPPFFRPTCKGLAFDPEAGALFVLNGNTFEVKKIDAESGDEIPGAEVVLQAESGASLSSLSYDSETQVLWSIDTAGDRIFGFNADTGETVQTILFPGDSPPEQYLYGAGVSRLDASDVNGLFLLWGDIFSERADRVRVLGIPGYQEIYTIPLAAVEAGAPHSLVATQDGAYLLVRDGATMMIAKIDNRKPDVVAPGDLTCTPQIDGAVELAWSNRGTLEDNAYDTIRIERNGVLLETISGGRESYTDDSGPDGTVTYMLLASQNLQQAPAVSRTLRNRRGAVLDWLPFPGGFVSAIAVDPDTGEIWVADSRLVTSSTYRIWRFSSTLDHLDTIEVTLHGTPAGLTFWPDSPSVQPPETLLLISNEATNVIQKVRRDGTPEGAFPLRLDAVLEEGFEENPKAGALEYDPGNGSYFLAVLDTEYQHIVWVNENGYPPEAGATGVKRMCAPSEISGIKPRYGLSISPQSGFLQTGIENGSIHELNDNCYVTTFDLNAALPSGDFSSTVLRDFAYSEDSLYLTSPATNCIFRVLAYPIGSTFVRGDANGSEDVDIADAVTILGYLFEEEQKPLCLDALDANDDGVIDISDPVYLLFFLFGQDYPAPPPPYPEPGLDPTRADDLTCVGL